MRLAATFALLVAAACGAEEIADAAPEDDVLEVGPWLDVANAKADAAGGQTELKVTIRADQVASAVAKFKLTDATAEHRTVAFYDTPKLELFAEGLILRTRKVKRGADDSTVKLRPLVAAEVAKKWFAVSGFKCEEDRTGAKSVESCSLTVVQARGEIDAVAAGDRPIDKLFSSEQETFARTYADRAPAWSRLVVLGPIASRAWKFSVRGFAPKLAAERWTLPNGSDLLEISTKVPRAQADATARALASLLGGKGFDTSSPQETKTRVALEYFAAH